MKDFSFLGATAAYSVGMFIYLQAARECCLQLHRTLPLRLMMCCVGGGQNRPPVLHIFWPRCFLYACWKEQMPRWRAKSSMSSAAAPVLPCEISEGMLNGPLLKENLSLFLLLLFLHPTLSLFRAAFKRRDKIVGTSVKTLLCNFVPPPSPQVYSLLLQSNKQILCTSSKLQEQCFFLFFFLLCLLFFYLFTCSPE